MFPQVNKGVSKALDAKGGSLDAKGSSENEKTFSENESKEVYLKLLPNPSHLETVAPVVVGYCRAQIDIAYNGDESKIIPILIRF